MKSSFISRVSLVIKKDGLGEEARRIAHHLECRLASKLREKEWAFLPAQEELLAEIFKGKFTLIILDACRYDFFRKIYRPALKGDLKAVKSPASSTPAWLEMLFINYSEHLKDVRIFSTNPHLNSKRISVSGSEHASSYLRENVMDLWDWGWDKELGTVNPNTLVRIIKKEGLKERNIVWIMQPHFPWIGKTRLIIPEEIQQLMKKGQSLNRYLAKQIRRNKISIQVLIKAYEDNLVLSIDTVKKLFNGVKPVGRVVITSDHGELLGEHGAFMHPSYLNLPEQRIVPWLEI